MSDKVFTGIPEEWEHDALCTQTDPEIFFPDQGGSTREAKRICGRCPVVDECLDRAMSFDGEVWGVWGATTQRDRRVMRRARQAVAA